METIAAIKIGITLTKTAKSIVAFFDQQRVLDKAYAEMRDEFINELAARVPSPLSLRWARPWFMPSTVISSARMWIK